MAKKAIECIGVPRASLDAHAIALAADQGLTIADADEATRLLIEAGVIRECKTHPGNWLYEWRTKQRNAAFRTVMGWPEEGE